MFTSRAEYRILLRQDDADERLTERSYALGLATQERHQWWLEKKEAVNRLIDLCANTSVKPKEINRWLESNGSSTLKIGCKVIDLIGRPEITLNMVASQYPTISEFIETLPNRQDEIVEAAEVRIKYKGYIERERQFADKMHRLENIRIRDRFDYDSLQSLSTECRQKLKRINPETIAQASRIPGVSPSDINVLLVLLGR